KEMEKFGEKLINSLKYLGHAIIDYKFSSEAQSYGDKIKNILNRTNITETESDRQVSNVIDSASPKIQQELAKFLFWIGREFINQVFKIIN
uniref:Uncharacterized protein n=1 Tax=Acrobeloides nanus TaxID=290746 RepID=A0A914CYQ9_9BILA